MSGSTIGGVVGGVIGFWFGGPGGAQVGWMIGSAVGGYVDPDVIKTSGPKWSDAPQQTARDGVPIPYGWGTFPTTGNLIWNAPVVETEIVSRTREGKGGGPVNENHSWQYTISYAIGICEGPIAGLLIIKRDGKIVYDARTDAELTAVGYDAAAISQTRAASAAFIAGGVRIYLGDETQLPDSVIEAHKGVGNVSAYRGLAYIRFENDDISERQSIPQYEFVVVSQGTSAAGFGMAQWAATSGAGFGRSDNGTAWDEATTDLTATADGPGLAYGGGILLKYGTSADLYYSPDRGVTWIASSDNFTSPTVTVGARYINGQFWMVNTTGANDCASSADADTWATQNVDTLGAHTTIGGHAGMIVIGDNQGFVCFSLDNGLTWSGQVNAMGGAAIHDIATNGSQVIAVGAGNNIFVTTNGSTWTEITTPFASGDIKRIRYSQGLGLWCAMTSSAIAYAADETLTSWTLATTPAGFTCRGLDANDEMFVIVGEVANDTAIFYSTDANNWSLATEVFPLLADGLADVAAMPCDGTPIPGSPGFYVHDDGTICGPAGDTLTRENVVVGTIVADVCQREGLDASEYDVSDLTDTVMGFRVATESDGVSIIVPLLLYSFADAAEWDGKLRFVKRGGPSVLTLTMDDLAERDGDAIEQVRVQEAELLRKNTVSYVDPLATYTLTTQTWERRASTILAKGEGSTDFPVVSDGTTMVHVAEKRGKVSWAESEKFNFSLPQKFSRITPTDVLTLVDSKAVAHRIRAMQIEEDTGVLLFEEAARDHEASYTGTTSPAAPTIPPPVPPTVRGPTLMVAFNGPPPNLDANAKSGIWVAVRGMLTGWAGCNLFISFDGGETETFIQTLTNQARIGWLRSGITSSSATIPVQFYGDAEVDTVSQAQLDAFQNVWIIKTGDNAEFGQSQTSTPNGDGFDLTDNERGLLSTPVTSHNADDDFVMVDTACYYIPVDLRYSGFTLYLRAASAGTAAANNTTTTLVYDPPEIVWDGNGDDSPTTGGVDPPDGGTGSTSTGLPSLTIGATSVNVDSYGAVGDGVTDDSAAFAAAFAALPVGGGTVVATSGKTYAIDPSYQDSSADDTDRCGIKMLNNTRLDLTGATLQALNTNSDFRFVVQAYEKHDWEIKGGTIIGWKDDPAWTGPTSTDTKEHGHGIAVYGSGVGIIKNVTIKKCPGDCISVGRRLSASQSEDVYIWDCVLSLSRRQGISIGRSDTVKVKGCTISYISGTAPQAGIDVEPDSPATQQSTNTTITDCYIHHCKGPGIQTYKSANGTSTIEGCTLEYNNRGVYAIDADGWTVKDCTIRFNLNSGISLTGTSSGWTIGGSGDENTLYGNKTSTYGTPSAGLDTDTITGTSTTTAKQLTIASTSSATVGANIYGPV